MDNFYGLFLQIKCSCMCSVMKCTLLNTHLECHLNMIWKVHFQMFLGYAKTLNIFGGTPIFSIHIVLDDFLGFKILNFNILYCFLENMTILGFEIFVDIFWGDF